MIHSATREQVSTFESQWAGSGGHASFVGPRPRPQRWLETDVIKPTTDKRSIQDLVEVAKVWRLYSQQLLSFLSATASGYEVPG